MLVVDEHCKRRDPRNSDRCVLRRPETLGYQDDHVAAVEICDHLEFDRHVVIEHLTAKRTHGWEQSRLEHEGVSPETHLELGHVTMPEGPVGFRDSYFGRASGEAHVDYKW